MARLYSNENFPLPVVEELWRLGHEQTVTEEEIRTSEEKWDELFARPEAKRVMREMARKALDYQAKRTTNVAITKDGRLAPNV